MYHFDTLAIYYALNSYLFYYILVKLILSYFNRIGQDLKLPNYPQ